MEGKEKRTAPFKVSSLNNRIEASIQGNAGIYQPTSGVRTWRVRCGRSLRQWQRHRQQKEAKRVVPTKCPNDWYVLADAQVSHEKRGTISQSTPTDPTSRCQKRLAPQASCPMYPGEDRPPDYNPHTTHLHKVHRKRRAPLWQPRKSPKRGPTLHKLEENLTQQWTIIETSRERSLLLFKNISAQQIKFQIAFCLQERQHPLSHPLSCLKKPAQKER